MGRGALRQFRDQPRPMNLGLLMSEGTGRTRLHMAFMSHAQGWIEAQSTRLLGLKGRGG